ncbi:MAG: DEAD/DEAH box helicase [Gammaproteobacteria bacterium]|nr:DEAD/DEAH box helicase [Gammaproteobacteria bacterium]
MNFSELGLPEVLLRAITKLGHEQPTEVQGLAIPLILEQHDLLAAAQTGTGKTGAFALPILARMRSCGPKGCAPRALIMTPTRELATQVAGSFRDYGQFASVRTETVFGGVAMVPQIKALRRGIDVLVATPGRLLDHVTQRTVDLSRVEILVLDEADRMLDMGFLPPIRRITELLPKTRQSLLFSATFSPEVRKLAAGLLSSPREVDVAPRTVTADTVAQRVLHVTRERKRDLLLHLLTEGDGNGALGRTLVFARTRFGAERLAEQLDRDGVAATAIHGNKSQSQRLRALEHFRRGKVRALVATDVAARGIDVSGISHVVNFELPKAAEDYVHRIGRTGRAGASGIAVSLVSGDERGQLKDIERLLGRRLETTEIEGFTTAAPSQQDSRPRPAHRRHNGPGNRNGHGGYGRDRQQPGSRERFHDAPRAQHPGKAAKRVVNQKPR